MKLLLVILTSCFVCACHSKTKISPDNELRESVTSFFASKGDSDIRSMIYAPKGVSSASIDRTVREQIAIRSILVQPVEIVSTTIHGNWAKILFSSQLATTAELVAYRLNGDWLFLFDSVGSYTWGKQSWLAELSQKDQEDYKLILKTKLGEQDVAPDR